MNTEITNLGLVSSLLELPNPRSVELSSVGINTFRSLGLSNEISPQMIYGGDKVLNDKGIEVLPISDISMSE